MLNLRDTYHYYQGLPHQEEAIAYLNQQINPEVREKFTRLWRTPNPQTSTPKTNSLADKIIAYCLLKNYKIELEPGEIFIVYLEGCDVDGKPNSDRPNYFNDRRILIHQDHGIPKIILNCEATTEPGDYYTEHPMNAAGAARIKFGQYRAWQVGYHGSHPYEALVQTAGVISVFRDRNKDYSRAGDKEFQGTFGVNQHHGYDSPINNVGRNSAGCLVGRTIDGHRKFMQLVKSDPRYKKNPQYAFLTTIIAADDMKKLVG